MHSDRVMELYALVIAIVIALVAFALIAAARRGRRAREWLMARGVEVEGEVVDVWQDGTGSFCVRYRFTPQGSTVPITRDEYAGCLKAALPAVGERVSVRYDPESPERASVQRTGC